MKNTVQKLDEERIRYQRNIIKKLRENTINIKEIQQKII